MAMAMATVPNLKSISGAVGMVKVLALPGSARQVVSFRNLNNFNQNHNNYLLFTSRPSTYQFRPIPILPRINHFSSTCYYSTGLEKEEEEEEEEKDALSSLSSTRSCSCNCQNTSPPSIQINIVFPRTLQLGIVPIITMLGHLFTQLYGLLQDLFYESGIFFQVAVLDKDQALRRKLNKIAKKADASTLYDPKYVFREVVKALLQYNDSSFHFTNLYTEVNYMTCTRKSFKEILNRELDGHEKGENAWVNVDDKVEYNSKGSSVIANSSTENEYTVVTVFMLATGTYIIPLVEEEGKSCHDCVQVLQTLRRVPKYKLQSVKVSWSPRKDDAVLLEDELHRDFPRLKHIQNGRLVMDI